MGNYFFNIHAKRSTLTAAPRTSVACSGFTLVEVIIVISITLILVGVSSVIYGNLQVSTQLNDVSAQIVQNLRLARQQSISGLNNVAHGIKFDATQITVYQGESYATRTSTYDRIYSFDSSLLFATTFAGNEVVFSSGVGAPSTSGTITITHSVSGSRTVVLNSQGLAQEQ